MKQTDAVYLLKKHKAGKCSPEEFALLESWYLQWNVDDEISFTEAELHQVQQEMWSGIAKAPVRKVMLWKRIAVAAAVIMAVLGIWLFNNSDRHSVPPLGTTYANDIAPGKNGATITLASGEVIQLSDVKTGVVIGEGKLAYNDNTLVAQNPSRARFGSDSEVLTASTTKGQTYEFTLPDGTKAWLNAATFIKFPSNFSGASSRNIELSGEAYFEVAKDKKHPFIVKTKGQEITVLGTHFNVNAYPEDQTTKTTLLEGLVRVVAEAGSSGRAVILKPGQRAAINGSDIHVDEVDVDEAVAWKEGYFTFNRESLERVMSQISRWYDVEIIYQDERIKSIPFSGSITRFGNISEILRKVELTEEVRFKVEGRKIFINHH